MENWKKFLSEDADDNKQVADYHANKRKEKLIGHMATLLQDPDHVNFAKKVSKILNLEVSEWVAKYADHRLKEFGGSLDTNEQLKAAIGSPFPDLVEWVKPQWQASQSANKKTQTKTTVIDKSGPPPKVVSTDWDKENRIWIVTVQGPKGYAQGKGEYNGNMGLAERAATMHARAAYYRGDFIEKPSKGK